MLYYADINDIYAYIRDIFADRIYIHLYTIYIFTICLHLTSTCAINYNLIGTLSHRFEIDSRVSDRERERERGHSGPRQINKAMKYLSYLYYVFMMSGDSNLRYIFMAKRENV